MDKKESVLTREFFMTKQILKIKKVCFEDGKYCYVREMTGKERDMWERSCYKKVQKQDGSVVFEQTMDNFRAKLVVIVLCDKEGKSLLAPEEANELAVSINGAMLQKIHLAANDINNIVGIEKTVKNLEAVRNGSSISGSVKN